MGDRPGFVANWLLFGYLGDAVRLLDSGRVTRGVAGRRARRQRHADGPLALLDLIGLDVLVHVLGVLLRRRRSCASRGAFGLASLVSSGTWVARRDRVSGAMARVPGPAAEVDSSQSSIADALVLPYLNDALRMVEEGYASPDDVDTAMRAGCGFPRGPVEEADRARPGCRPGRAAVAARVGW